MLLFVIMTEADSNVLCILYAGHNWLMQPSVNILSSCGNYLRMNMFKSAQPLNFCVQNEYSD